MKINSQNISKKYKLILGDEYETFNLSHDKNFDEFIRKPGKKIIAGCITNHRRVYDIINEYNIDSCIWFDEAHWGIEGWIDKGLNEVQDFLLNSDNIKYRIYTSASPNVEKVENNERIFGELFKEITVKKLIELKYLCNIKPFIFEVQEYNVNYCKTILEDFKNYKTKFRKPVRSLYKNYQVLSNPLPSTGGTLMTVGLDYLINLKIAQLVNL